MALTTETSAAPACADPAALVVATLSLPSGRLLMVSRYRGEEELPAIMALMAKDLSEPYSIFTYRFFLHNWPELCFVVRVWARRALPHLWWA
jgi:hypothetical protein